MKIWLRVSLPSPGRGCINVSATKYKKQVLTVVFFSGIYATITYCQFGFLYNLVFLQAKGMRHALDPLHWYSLGVKEAL